MHKIYSLFASALFAVSAFGVLAATGCAQESAEAELFEDDLIGGVLAKGELPGTLLINRGCTATRVGQKHILLAGHCVMGSGSNAAKFANFAPGNGLSVQQAAIKSRRKSDPWAPSPISVYTIAKTTVHPSFVDMCAGSGCGLTTQFTGADIAVIELEETLPRAIPIIPVSSKAVPVGTEVTLAGTGCEVAVGGAAPATGQRRLKFEVTKTLGIQASVHPGSQIQASVSDAALVDSMMLVTPGPVLDAEAAGLCPGDSGGPLYGPGQRTVVGVAASYTFAATSADTDSGRLPVTNWHTRTDDAGRFRIATWLSSLGVVVR